MSRPRPRARCLLCADRTRCSGACERLERPLLTGPVEEAPYLPGAMSCETTFEVCEDDDTHDEPW